MCAYVPHVCLLSTEGIRSRGNGVADGCEPPMCVLVVNQASVRAASALDY